MINSSSRRVLVVDDEPSVREMLSDFLEMNNFICMQAENGESALAVTRREQFDLIIMDVRMPGVSGIDALREIKRELPEQPIVMVTAVAEVETAVEAMRLGANDYVLKPFVLHDMLSKVDEAIVTGFRGTVLAPDQPDPEVEQPITIAVGTPIEEPTERDGAVVDERELTALTTAVQSLAGQVSDLEARIRSLGRSRGGARSSNGNGYSEAYWS